MSLSKELFEFNSDRVAQMFENKTILITGASGFIGKVLLEKLLRSCPDINKVYVLLRPKHGLTSEKRLQIIFQSALFDTLKKSKQSMISKVNAINGDIGVENVGLSKNAFKALINKVDIVYHCGALLRFDETLRNAVLINVRGTKFMLDLASQMKKLKVFCYVSSAYCHIHERIIYEKPYEVPIDPLQMIEICETLKDSLLSPMTHKILGRYPNTYCYTKCLSEGLINNEYRHLPIVLLRPSLVIPAMKEPIPGWTDTINGSIGFQIVAGKGLLRTLYADVKRYPDLIPVDIAVGAFICAAFDYLKHQPNTPPRYIYNLTSSDRYKVSWHDIIYIGRAVIIQSVPLNWVVWYPGGRLKSTRFLHNLTFLIQHVLPGYLIDFFLQLFNFKPVLMPIYRRIQKGFDILKFYNGKQWDFSNKYAVTAMNELNTFEKNKYNLDIKDIDYYEYFRNCTLCARRYILNESDETIPRAKQHMKMMYYIDKIVLSSTLIWISSTISNYCIDYINIF